MVRIYSGLHFMKILLVEDDEIIARTLADILRDRHYIVDLASEGELGWEMVEAYDYDLIVLDVVLPKLNGINFCHKLRNAGNQTPVLLLTAENSGDQKVMGLDAGADDYVVKPFEISELLARIRVLLRRRNSLVSQILHWGNLSLNLSTHEVTYEQQTVNLTPKEYRLLELFLRSSDHESSSGGNRVLTRELILDRLWDIAEAPNENTVTAHIKDLRRKLKQVGVDADLIETVYGVGYRLKSEASLTENKSSQLADDRPAKSIRTEDTEQLVALEQNQIETEETRQETRAALAEVWHKYEGSYQKRLAILEQACQAWQAGRLKGQLLKQAQWAAHKLAGGLGVFGFSQGSYIALEMEQLLKIELAVDRSKQFSALLAALKNSLKPNLKTQLNSVNRNRPVILAVDSNPELVQQLTDEMTAIGTVFELVAQPASLKKALQTSVDAVVLEFSLAECDSKTLDNFATIVNTKIPLPVILFTDHNARDHRLKISRLGGHILLQQASLNIKAVKAIR